MLAVLLVILNPDLLEGFFPGDLFPVVLPALFAAPWDSVVLDAFPVVEVISRAYLPKALLFTSARAGARERGASDDSHKLFAVENCQRIFVFKI